MYAKFINDKMIEEAPKNKGSFFNYNDEGNAAMLLADGYKPLANTPAVPADMIQPVIRYRNLKGCIEPYYEEIFVLPQVYEPTYAELRAAEYPPMADFLDAQVKINSGDNELISEGQVQLSAYYEKCLEIKAKYPKTFKTKGGENA